MPITGACHGCGKKFQAPDKLAGKRVKCPKCGEPIQLAGTAPSSPTPKSASQPALGKKAASTTTVQCDCGKKLRAKKELAGKRVKCPGCGKPLTLPGQRPTPKVATSSDVDLDSLFGDEMDAIPSVDLPAASLPVTSLPVTSPAATSLAAGEPMADPLRPAKPKKSGNRRLIIGLSAGGGAVVLAVILAIVFWPKDNGDGTNPGETNPAPRGAAMALDPPEPRRYPSLPDAVTKPPSWTAGEAPFDVKAYLTGPAFEENAAPLYLDALFEFDAGLEICFPEDTQQTRQRADATQARWDQWYQLTNPEAQESGVVDQAAVDAWLKQFDGAFEKLAATKKRSQCVFQADLNTSAELPHLQACQELLVVLKERTACHLRQGDIDRAIEELSATFRLIRDMRPRGGLFCQNFCNMREKICCNDIVTTILRSPGLRADHCDSLLAGLADHRTESADPLVEAAKVEYLKARWLLYQLQHRMGKFQLDASSTPTVCIGRLMRDDRYAFGERLLLEDPHWASLSKPATAEVKQRLEQLDRQILDMSAAQFQAELSALNRYYGSLLELADKTELERCREFTSLGRPLRDTKVAILFEPNMIPEAGIVRQATLAGTQCLIALRRWQLMNQEPPSDLDAVMKAAGMEQVPIDPGSNMPMRMTTIDGSPVIYSVGIDGQDGQAVIPWTGIPSEPSGDMVFRL